MEGDQAVSSHTDEVKWLSRTEGSSQLLKIQGTYDTTVRRANCFLQTESVCINLVVTGIQQKRENPESFPPGFRPRSQKFVCKEGMKRF